MRETVHNQTGRLPAPPPPDTLEICKLAKDYHLPIIEDLTLRIGTGEFVCLLGPNGCGKTTLLRIVAGLEEADRGEILVGGAPIAADSSPSQRIGVVFQEPRLLPWRSVQDNIAHCLKPLGIRGEEARRRANRFLDLVGLRGFAGYFPGRLSGGMQQRAAIARALAIEPTLLLMDEPFSALDPETRRIMQDALLAIWAVTKITILFVTHDIDEAQRLGTRIILFSARPARIRADSASRADSLSGAELRDLLAAEVHQQRGGGAGEVSGG